MARTAKKTASYSVMHMAVAIGVAYALTGSFAVALGIGLVEPLVQTVAYHLHERAWAGAGGDGNTGHDPGHAAGRMSLDGAAGAGA